jgi:hypothetical protein
MMKERDHAKSANKPLQQFRFEIYRQRKFLKRFYTPLWLQPQTKAHLLSAILLWLFAVIILVWYKNDFNTSNFYFLFFTSAMVTVARCMAYYKFKRERKRFCNRHL